MCIRDSLVNRINKFLYSELNSWLWFNFPYQRQYSSPGLQSGGRWCQLRTVKGYPSLECVCEFDPQTPHKGWHGLFSSERKRLDLSQGAGTLRSNVFNKTDSPSPLNAWFIAKITWKWSDRSKFYKKYRIGEYCSLFILLAFPAPELGIHLTIPTPCVCPAPILLRPRMVVNCTI